MGRETQGFAGLSPAQRSLAAAVGSLHNWSRHTSKEARRAATQPMRDARRANIAARIDPDGDMDPVERDAAVDRLIKAQMKDLARRSSVSRAKRKEAA